ncbi:HAD family hydrolase [Enterococcus faecalis]
MKKAVIFDCDGVLVDSEILYLNSLLKYLKTLGIETTIDEVKFVVGMKAYEIAEALQRKFELNQVSIEELIQKQDEYQEREMAAVELQPMSGLIDFLDSLKNQGYKLAIASSSLKNYVENVCRRIGILEYFDLLVTGEQVSNSKPDPEIFNKTVELLGIPKEETLIVEDSVNGIKAAKSSGVFVVGYKGSVIEQDTTNADAELKTFVEIQKYL